MWIDHTAGCQPDKELTTCKYLGAALCCAAVTFMAGLQEQLKVNVNVPGKKRKMKS